MKRVVFIVERYYPMPSAVSMCVRPLADELSSRYEVVIIAKGTTTSHAANIQTISVHPFDERVRNYALRLRSKSVSLGRITGTALGQLVRCYNYIRAHLGFANVRNADVDAYCAALQRIDDIHAIFPSCLPFEAVLAALKYKANTTKSVKVVPLLFDMFSSNPTLHRTTLNRAIKARRHLELERKMIEEADAVIHVKGWRAHLVRNFSYLQAKFHEVEHPLIRKRPSYIMPSHSLTIVYAGALYKRLRSPIPALEFLGKMLGNSTRLIDVMFYSSGDCQKMLQKWSKKYPSIRPMGFVSPDVLETVIARADILLSIGNMDANQFPSKIFDYISTGKRIIHVYTNNDDPVVDVLRLYPRALCVSAGEYNVNQVQQFLTSDVNPISFDVITDIFKEATPGCVANTLLELVQQ